MAKKTVTTLVAAALLAAPLAGAALADDSMKDAKSQPAAEHGAKSQPAAAKGQPAAQGASMAGLMPSDDIIGSEVYDKQGQELGSVRNLLIDDDGRVKAAVISLGGVFGLGDRRVQVPWNALELKPKPDDRDELMVTASRETLQNAPQYDESRTAAAARSMNGGRDADDPRAASAPATR